MTLDRPIVLRIADGVYAVNEFGLASMFIVCGSRRALVLDTGMGCFDFRALVESVTSLPYTVALTHGHLDHCGGMDQFDAVYLHPADTDLAIRCTREERMAAAERMRGLEGDADTWAYAASQVRRWERVPELRALGDESVFDLGGRVIQCVHTPGHSAGSCCFIDSGSRILFSGDACNVSLRVTACPAEEALAGLRKLKAHESQFDRNFNGHLAYSSGLYHISMPQTALDDCVEALGRIVSGRAEPSARLRSRFGDQPPVRTYMYGAISVTWAPGLRED